MLIDISIVIVNYRGWKDLERCLFTLESIGNGHFTFEVIIVDNCSNDGRLAEFIARFPKFSFFVNSGNNGFSNGCNVGAASSKGTYLLFLNPDIEASEMAITGLLEASQLNQDIMILSCKQLNSNLKEERQVRFFPSYLTLNGMMRAFYRKANQNELSVKFSPENEIVYPDWVSGSVIFISKANFEILGGWDESFWLYYEDVDLCFRTRLAGGKVALTNKVQMIHNHGGSTRVNLQTAALTKAEVIISLHVFLSKHNSGIRALGLHFMVIAGGLTSKLIPALLGIPLFFVKRLNVYSRLYLLLVTYYFQAVGRRSWLSSRSIKFRI
ncbi:MAG: glycosyltransferase family 2 protein [Prolixibacteraceae bacterium]|jgi:hypothetical protein